MQSVNFPPTLLQGDAISIIAPASAVEKEYVEQTIKSLIRLGYNIVPGKNIYREYNQFAGNDAQRMADVQEVLDDRDIKAIFCARGGYGSIRIIDSLDFSDFRKNPKWIIGFSDISVFHSFLNCNYHIPTIHAPMPVNFGSPFFQENLQQLNSILKGELPEIKFKSNVLNRFGRCRGKLIGGNLSILYSLQSTPYEIDTRHAILFIEDVGEQLYHLDRILNNFHLSGKFRKLKGLIVGCMTDMLDKKKPFGKTAFEIVREAAESYNFPITFDFPAGHADYNIPFVLGAEAELVVDRDGTHLRYIQ